MVADAPEPSGPVIHSHRVIAESFGDDPERYDRARPRYPRALADAVIALLPGPRIVDVGIGTGISALPFREAGAEVVGVEVDARMAERARSRGFEVDVSAFEDWPGPRGPYDGVIAGQAWHWIDPVAGPAKAASLLRSGGLLVPFWNSGDPEPEVAQAFAEVYRSVETGLPFTPYAAPLNAYAGMTERAADGIRASGLFEEPGLLAFDWQTTISRADWLDVVPTMGGHSRIPKHALHALLDGLGRVVEENGGSFVMSYTTVAVIAKRR